MQWSYDGQIRRYLTQVMRLMSNFPVKDSSGNIKPVPIMYGDLTRQVAHIIRDNSENKLPSAPRMSVYMTSIEQDRSRTTDSTYTKSVNVIERQYDQETGEYLNVQGANYTVERLIPTPYILKVNVDIWTTGLDQKLQIIEPILTLFNPSLEIQTTDNFVDWTSITVVNLEGTDLSNRSIPVGVDSEIDITTLSFSLPIYLSAPAKVKKMGIITNIITSIFDENTGTIETGVSQPQQNEYSDTFPNNTSGTGGNYNNTTYINYDQYPIYIENDIAEIVYRRSEDPIVVRLQDPTGQIDWRDVFEIMPGNYIPNVSRIFLKDPNSDSEITGTFSTNPENSAQIIINWDQDSFPQDTVISGPTGDKTTIDYIIDPTRWNPEDYKITGMRILLLGDIGAEINQDGADAWKGTDGSELIARENDIIEWNGVKWVIVFDSNNITETTYVTNLNTNTQYKFVNGEWLLSVNGEYAPGFWRLDMYG